MTSAEKGKGGRGKNYPKFVVKQYRFCGGGQKSKILVDITYGNPQRGGQRQRIRCQI